MNKVDNVHELKLVLSNLRTDQGNGLDSDLEQVTIELKLDEGVRQHIIKVKEAQLTNPSNGETFFELTSSQGTPLSGIYNTIFSPRPPVHSVFIFKTFNDDCVCFYAQQTLRINVRHFF